MNRNNEKNVVATICRISQEYDYSNQQDIKRILSTIQNNALFQNTSFGMRYRNRLLSISKGTASSGCILCGKQANNRVVCDVCISMINQYTNNRQKISVDATSEVTEYSNSAESNATVIEDLFKDMDDSLMKLASQRTVGTIKKLAWINMALSVINSIVIFFLALFLWKFIMAQ